LNAFLDSKLANPSTRSERNELILKVLSAYSPSGSESNVAQILDERLRLLGLDSHIDRVGNVVSAIGKGDAILLLCGHMDTVPGEIEVRQEGDRVWGRGACDAKGALLSLLFAFEDLSREEKVLGLGRIIFAGVTEEERSSAGLMEIIQENIRADYAIFGEPGGLNRITIGYRGHVTARLEVVTREVHASAPKLSTNSVEVIFEIYQKFKESASAEGKDSVADVSTAITEISGGTAHNTIPGRSTATVDIRVPLGRTTQQLTHEFETVLAGTREKYPDATISVAYDEPTEPYSVKLDSPIVRAINRSILKAGEKPVLIKKSGTGDMNTYATTFHAECITYGPGEASLSHTTNERVSIEEIFSCSKILAEAAKELFTLAEKKDPQNKEDL
jgi:LysW-gamma-L-lysine carboxypeptidase